MALRAAESSCRSGPLPSHFGVLQSRLTASLALPGRRLRTDPWGWMFPGAMPRTWCVAACSGRARANRTRGAGSGSVPRSLARPPCGDRRRVRSLALGGSQGSSAMPAADPAPVLVLFCRVVEGPMDALARSVGVIEGQDRLGADDLPHVACVAVDDLDARPAGPGQPAVLRAAIATHGPLDHEHPPAPQGAQIP